MQAPFVIHKKIERETSVRPMQCATTLSPFIKSKKSSGTILALFLKLDGLAPLIRDKQPTSSNTLHNKNAGEGGSDT